ncbi:MAG: helix-turn-helix domain-containing protein [Chthoniobacterales bacterium]
MQWLFTERYFDIQLQLPWKTPLPLPPPFRQPRSICCHSRRLPRLWGDATRWRMIAELAKGEPLMVSELATRLGRSPGLISKHIARLREAGLVEVGRARLYNIPSRFLRTPGVADYGHCQIPAAQKAD